MQTKKRSSCPLSPAYDTYWFMLITKKKKVKYRLLYWRYIGKRPIVTGVNVKYALWNHTDYIVFQILKSILFDATILHYYGISFDILYRITSIWLHESSWRCVDLILILHIIKWKKRDHKWFPGKWKLPAHQLHLACITSPRKQLSLSFRSLLSDALSLPLFAIAADVMYPE